MSTELVKANSEFSSAAAELSQHLVQTKMFEGLQPSYVEDVINGLYETQGQEVAANFVSLLQQFSGGGSQYSLSNIDYASLSEGMFDDEDAEELGGGSTSYERDPLRNAKLTQRMTKGLPKGVGSGVVFDSMLGEVVAHTADDDGNPKKAKVYILTWHASRAMFDPNSTSSAPTCMSRDGVINKFGGACKPCGFRLGAKGSPSACTSQLNAVVLSADFKHCYKIPFSKTGLKAGQMLERQHQARPKGHLYPVELSAKLEKNDKNEWYVLQGKITATPAADWTAKAIEILTQAYFGFFKRLMAGLLARHHEAKQKGESLLPPGSEGNLLTDGAGTPTKGVSASVWGNTGDVPVEEDVDLSSIGK